MFIFNVFLIVVLCLLNVFVYVFFDCKCTNLKRLDENNKTKQKETKQTTQLKEKHKTNNRNTGFPAHEPPRKIHISKGLAGRFLCFYVLFYVFLRVVLLFNVVYTFRGGSWAGNHVFLLFVYVFL